MYLFGFDKNDIQVCEMFKPSIIKGTSDQDDLIAEEQLIEKDFLPKEIGNSDYKFPTRTVLSCAKTIDWTNVIYPFGLVNIPLTYDKRRDLQYNNIKFNIKWGKGDEQRMIESYVECLMIMIRNKVLLNNGNLVLFILSNSSLAKLIFSCISSIFSIFTLIFVSKIL